MCIANLYLGLTILNMEGQVILGLLVQLYGPLELLLIGF